MTDIPYSEFQRTSRQLASLHGVEMVPAEVEQTMEDVLSLFRKRLREMGWPVPQSDVFLMEIIREAKEAGR